MTNGWKTCDLGDVLERTETIDPTRNPDKEFYYIDVSSINNKTLSIETVSHLKGSEAPSRARKLVRTNDVIFATVRPTLKRIALIPEQYDQQVCSTGYFVLRGKEFIDNRFLFYFLQTDEVFETVEKTQKGASYPAITDSDVKGLHFGYPPIEEQRRIVAILDEAFACIDKAKANTEKNIQNARELFDSYLNNIFSNPGPDWESSSLENCNRFIDYRGKTPVKTQSGIRLITAKNVKPGYLTQEPEEFIAKSNYSMWMTRGIPQKGDVLFTTEAPLANVAQLDTDEKVAFAQRIIILQPDRKRLNDRFLKYQLLSRPAKEKIMKHGSGATVQGIKARLLKTVQIAFPNKVSEQKEMADRLDIMWDECWNAEDAQWSKIEELEKLKKSILQKAFSGRL